METAFFHWLQIIFRSYAEARSGDYDVRYQIETYAKSGADAGKLVAEKTWTSNIISEGAISVTTEVDLRPRNTTSTPGLTSSREGYSAFLRENFLTTFFMRRVAPGSTLSLFPYAESGESLEYSVQHTFQTNKSEARFIHSYFMDTGKTAATSEVVQINVPF